MHYVLPGDGAVDVPTSCHLRAARPPSRRPSRPGRRGRRCLRRSRRHGPARRAGSAAPPAGWRARTGHQLLRRRPVMAANVAAVCRRVRRIATSACPRSGTCPTSCTSAPSCCARRLAPANGQTGAVCTTVRARRLGGNAVLSGAAPQPLLQVWVEADGLHRRRSDAEGGAAAPLALGAAARDAPSRVVANKGDRSPSIQRSLAPLMSSSRAS